MRRAARVLLIALALTCVSAPAQADEYSRRVAQAVIQAADSDSKSEDRLAELIHHDATDLFLVVHHIEALGESHVVARVLQLAPAPLREPLQAYVARLKGTPCPDLAEIERALASAATPEDRLAALETLPDSDDALTTDLLRRRAHILLRLDRRERAADDFLEAAERARRIAWWRCVDETLPHAIPLLEESGDHDRVLLALERHADSFRARGDALGEAGHLMSVSNHATRMGHSERSVAAAERADALIAGRELPEGSERLPADVANVLGVAHFYAGNDDEAVAAWKRARVAFTRLGDEHMAAGMTMNMANVLGRAGRRDEATVAFREAIRRGRELEQWGMVGAALANLSNVHQEQGELLEAIACSEEALALLTELGDETGRLHPLSSIASYKRRLGDLDASRRLLEEVLGESRRLGFRRMEASSLRELGNLERVAGANARSLRHHEASMAIVRDIAEPSDLIAALHSVGVARHALGDHEGALVALAEAERIAEGVGDIRSRRAALSLRARLVQDPEEVLACADEIGRLSDGRDALFQSMRASALYRLGRHDEAHKAFVGAIEKAREIGSPLYEARALMGSASCLVELDRRDEAIEQLERARTLANDVGAFVVMDNAIHALARLHFADADHARVVELTRESLALQPILVGELSEELGASARAKPADSHARGVFSAARIGDAAAALFLLESSRATGLVESLGGRDVLRGARVPEELAEAELAARGRLRQAREQLVDAKRRRKLKRIRAAKAELETAQNALLEAVDRIQREARGSAGLLYPDPVTVEQLQKVLRPGEAYVAYSALDEAGVALVVTPETLRAIPVALPEDARGTPAQVHAAASNGDELADDAALLRRHLVEPLKLPASVTTVLLSPSAELAYVPPALLFPDRTVACIASGTTLELLRATDTARDEDRPTRILGLGDPAYATGGPTRLPGTRVEVEAIADIRLLGPDATEPKLRDALAIEPRWRSIHLACHGVADAERPLLSSLLVTPPSTAAATADDTADPPITPLDPGDDGILTVHELLRLDLSADLVALSACETAQGRIYRGEGVLGFPRAVLLAGSPRALVSLWKVDDAATSALMIRFYELWNGAAADNADNASATPKRMGAARALRQAQAHVRAQEEWSHPRFWAAWVLWGLAE